MWNVKSTTTNANCQIGSPSPFVQDFQSCLRSKIDIWLHHDHNPRRNSVTRRLGMLSLCNVIPIQRESLIGTIRCRFAGGSAHVLCSAGGTLVFHPNVPCQNPADDQGNDSE